jgi:hypothetical protein
LCKPGTKFINPFIFLSAITRGHTLLRSWVACIPFTVTLLFQKAESGILEFVGFSSKKFVMMRSPQMEIILLIHV